MALFVPLFKHVPFLTDLEKKNPEKSPFGKDLGLLIPQDLQGRGSSAFQHPIKVLKTGFDSSFLFLIF